MKLNHLYTVVALVILRDYLPDLSVVRLMFTLLHYYIMTLTRMLCSLKLGKRLLDIRAVSYGTIYLMTSKTLHHYYSLNID